MNPYDRASRAAFDEELLGITFPWTEVFLLERKDVGKWLVLHIELTDVC